jgi:uncharacterized damage-inducible protein DinB
MKTILIDYTNYNYWANKKICDLLVTLEDSLLEKDIPSSFRTIKQTLYHIWGAEWIWLLRIQTDENSLIQSPVKNFTGSFEEAIESFRKVSEEIIKLVSDTDENGLTKNITYQNLAGKEFTNRFYEIIMHCMNHSTFHRGQIITMLRNAGVTDLFSTDLINYYREL